MLCQLQSAAHGLFEDFGLTPLEVAAFGKPTAAPRLGGFLDTIVEGRTGVFYDRPDARPHRGRYGTRRLDRMEGGPGRNTLRALTRTASVRVS